MRHPHLVVQVRSIALWTSLLLALGAGRAAAGRPLNVVLLIGDNGYFQADRGLADKWYPYEESQRVPLVGPRPPGREDRPIRR